MRTFIHSRVRTPVRVSCIPHPLQWISNLTARWLYVYVCVCDCAQVCIILVITTIATGSVVTGLRSGLKTLSQVTFILGNILLFSLLFLDNTWYDAVSVVVTQCVLADCCLVRCCVSAHTTSAYLRSLGLQVPAQLVRAELGALRAVRHHGRQPMRHVGAAEPRVQNPGPACRGLRVPQLPLGFRAQPPHRASPKGNRSTLSPRVVACRSCSVLARREAETLSIEYALYGCGGNALMA